VGLRVSSEKNDFSPIIPSQKNSKVNKVREIIIAVKNTQNFLK
jgi:hypothetical protein